ncbi:Hypothetical predicted protein [Olea europaea subsp. europaea]|uniref:Uncharacterized protein n=1 Tax=Olea europaea subsp. europaea TaxID=158383 RepID=A0A8S0R9N5_OLEEU|nr:Hypothetical predicted protein [Olea europaea subsp. europaea]
MLVRRFISAVIHNQKRRILTASTRRGSNEKSTLSAATPSNSLSLFATQLGRRFNIRPILTRILLRAFSLHRLGANNAILATNRINGTLQYSIGMSAKESRQIDSVESEQQLEAARDSSELVRSRLEAYENHKTGNTLESLREAYAKISKSNESQWLDFADQSCYIYLYKGGGQPSETMAAFDLDGTLIRPKSNKRIPRSATDWELFSVWTKTKLQQCLRECPARFVIFTNQNGIGLNIVPLDEVQQRIELVTKRLDIPCTVFMATEQDEFRKPRLGMYRLFTESFNDSMPLDLSSSFYCGDAIGYPSHSDADIKFAQQLDLPFLTPEKFLRGVKPKLVS